MSSTDYLDASHSVPDHTLNRDPADDHDSPWKLALECYLPQALALLVPRLYAAIDWSMTPQFLDKELQSIGPPGVKGRQYVDKLASVRLLKGGRIWLLIHIEVQGRLHGLKGVQRFSQRMMDYRLSLQRHGMQVAGSPAAPFVYSLGILIKGRIGGEMDESGLVSLVHTYEFLGQGIRFTFPVVELDRWWGCWKTLQAQAPSNPFAVVLMAQLLASRHPQKATRLGPLKHLVRQLLGYGYSPQETRQILSLVEWMLTLPPALKPVYTQALNTLQQEPNMTRLTILEEFAIERGLKKGLEQGLEQGLERGLERGLEKGLEQGIERGLKKGLEKGIAQGQAKQLLRMLQHRFGSIPETTIERVRHAGEPQLEVWSINFVDAKTLDEVFHDQKNPPHQPSH